MPRNRPPRPPVAPVTKIPPAPALPLPRSFYQPSAEIVAPRLLGHLLLRNTPSGPIGGVIVETEAYIKGDPACHAFRGESARNRVMWGEPGHAYVYLIYGIYYCFNAVCKPAGEAEAVLVRAVEPTVGIEAMRHRRPVPQDQQLTSGPGKLCLAMTIDRSLDGSDLCSAGSQVYVTRNPRLKKTLSEMGPMITTTRIGITFAAELPLRFYLSGSSYVSKKVACAAHRTGP